MDEIKEQFWSECLHTRVVAINSGDVLSAIKKITLSFDRGFHYQCDDEGNWRRDDWHNGSCRQNSTLGR